MLIFLATPYSQLCDENYIIKDEYRNFFVSLTHRIKQEGVDYFLAVERENYGKHYSSDTESTNIDFQTIKKSDLVCVIPGCPISGGVHVELGWASANHKPIEIFLKKDAHYSPMVTGLSAITNTHYNYYQDDYSEDLIQLIVDRIKEYCTITEKPLYQKLLERPYPTHQRMDIESLRWLEDNLKIQNVSVESFINGYKKFPLKDVDFDTTAFCENSGTGIHGIRHQFRVAVFVWLLIQKLNLPMEYKDIIGLLQVSLYHDIMRKNDNSDENHGVNSANWIKLNYPQMDNKFIRAVEFHNQEVKDEDKTVYIKLLKTADAIDRYRLPKKKWWLKKEFSDYPINDDDLMIFKYITYNTERIAFDCNDVEAMKKVMLVWLEEEKII